MTNLEAVTFVENKFFYSMKLNKKKIFCCQVDEKGLNFRSYSVHINGILHCRLRYRQFHSFHLELRREFGPLIPQFPPKKLFTLNETEIEERRLNLEKYLQLVSQENTVLIDFF